MTINKEEYYTLQEVADILKVHKRTIIRKCQDESMVCNDIWTWLKPNYRIRGDNILTFIKDKWVTKEKV
jgi:hypothetical protein